jgi:hypothetical protein
VKHILLLGCYGCIFHGTGNLVQLCQNFGIPGGGGVRTPPNTLRYANVPTGDHVQGTVQSRYSQQPVTYYSLCYNSSIHTTNHGQVTVQSRYSQQPVTYYSLCYNSCIHTTNHGQGTVQSRTSKIFNLFDCDYLH